MVIWLHRGKEFAIKAMSLPQIRVNKLTLFENKIFHFKNNQGPVVQKPINTNPRLKVNQEFYFFTPMKVLFNADIPQNTNRSQF